MTHDQETTIAQLREEVRKFIEEREWAKYHTPKDLAISIAIEAGELMELFQWLREDEVADLVTSREGLARVEAELADIVIFCLSLANLLHTDLSERVLDKIRENKEKYPVEKVRGKYVKYTELGESK